MPSTARPLVLLAAIVSLGLATCTVHTAQPWHRASGMGKAKPPGVEAET